MPPAAKNKRLRRTTTIGKPNSEEDNAPELFGDATVKCKKTTIYASAYNVMTLASAKQVNRRIGTAKWYRLNKEALVAILVLNQFAEKIQKFFKHVTTGDKICGDSNSKVCPISLIPMSDIPYRYRFKHCDIWFNREFLAQHMRSTSDFINPVTRMEFHEEDVLKIDPRLIKQFRNRKELRAGLAEDMAMVQSVENELEDVFKTMVEAAQEISSRMEFRHVFDELAEDFQECLDDLIELDCGRSTLVLKSLPDIISGDPTRPIHMSKKRERILKQFVKDQLLIGLKRTS